MMSLYVKFDFLPKFESEYDVITNVFEYSDFCLSLLIVFHSLAMTVDALTVYIGHNHSSMQKFLELLIMLLQIYALGSASFSLYLLRVQTATSAF